MATTDPVNAAVARALAYGTELVKSGQTVDLAPRNILPWAAREALAPVRELHRPWRTGGVTYCEHCNQYCEPARKAFWPCASARLVYTSEELQ